MKIKIIVGVIIIIAVAGILMGLKRDKPNLGQDLTTTEMQSDTKEAIAPGIYKISQGQMVGWNAKKRVGGGHNGTVEVTNAEFETDGSVILSGKIELALDTLSVLDLEPGKGKEKLEGDLKGKDFFDTANYKTGTFVVTSSAPIIDGLATLVGDLTLKGKTEEVSIPIMLKNDSGLVSVAGTFNFNRTKFDINYASASIPGAVKDVIIEDEVGVTIANTFTKE